MIAASMFLNAVLAVAALVFLCAATRNAGGYRDAVEAGRRALTAADHLRDRVVAAEQQRDQVRYRLAYTADRLDEAVENVKGIAGECERLMQAADNIANRMSKGLEHGREGANS